MPNPAEYDLNFRPASFWDIDDPRLEILNRIQGSVRRELVRQLLDGESGGLADAELLGSTLEEDVREALGRFRPELMGGEYLPEYDDDEIEVARVDMDSVHRDVISVRARRLVEGGIRWRVVDEYEQEYELPFDRTEGPPSFAELVGMLDRTRLGFCFENLVVGFFRFQSACSQDPDAYRYFFSISSSFYPELGRWYREALEEAYQELAALVARGEEIPEPTVRPGVGAS